MAITGRRPRLLAVDDDGGMLNVFHLLLDDRYDVIAARDGEAALRCLLAEPVDLVLLDVVMDGLDGITLLQQMRRGGLDVPVVIVSAINTAWTAAAAMRLGAVDYITKPFEEAELVDAVSAALHRAAEAADFDCFLLAGRYTLLEQGALETFLPLCERRGIGVVIGGPLNSGILATGPVAGATYNYRPAPPAILERAGRLERVSASHGVSLAAAALQFPLAHPAVACVIPGARSAAEVEQNTALLSRPIPAALWRDLKAEGLVRADAPVPGG